MTKRFPAKLATVPDQQEVKAFSTQTADERGWIWSNPLKQWFLNGGHASMEAVINQCNKKNICFYNLNSGRLSTKDNYSRGAW